MIVGLIAGFSVTVVILVTLYLLYMHVATDIWTWFPTF